MLIKHQTAAVDGCASSTRPVKQKNNSSNSNKNPASPVNSSSSSVISSPHPSPSTSRARISPFGAMKWGGGPWAGSFFCNLGFQISVCSDARGKPQSSFACSFSVAGSLVLSGPCQAHFTGLCRGSNNQSVVCCLCFLFQCGSSESFSPLASNSF